MGRFRFNAITSAGALVAGELDAPSAEAVIAQLHERALFPIDATELHSPSAGLRLRGRRRTVLSGAELTRFTQQLGRLLSARVPLDRALAILRDLGGSAKARQTIDRVLARVRDGASLANALTDGGKGAFPPSLTAMVRAGETAGALPSVLASASRFLAGAEAMNQRVVSALIYPAILAILAAVSTSIALLLVLPQFESMFAEAGARLPAITVAVMFVSNAVRSFGWVAAVALIVLVLFWRRLRQHPTILRSRDRLVLLVPVVGPLLLKLEFGRFSRTLGVLLTNGVPVTRALGLSAATVMNTALAVAIEAMQQQIKQGERLSDALAQAGRFPPLTIQMVRLGEETGQLDTMLAEIGDIYDQEVQRSLDRLLTILVPAITIAMGAVIATIIAAIMTAMISINDLVA